MPQPPSVPAFNWPPTAEDLAELQTLDVDGKGFVSCAELLPVPAEGEIPAPGTATARLAIDSPWMSQRSQALGLAILLGLATAVGAGTALLISPRPSSLVAPNTESTWITGRSVARRDAAAWRDPSRPPDLTVIAEYPSVDVRAPRGALLGTLLPRPSAPPAVSSTPSVAEGAALAPVAVPDSLPSLALPSAPAAPPAAAAATATPPAVTRTTAAAAPIPTAVSERTAIERLLGQYRSAYERLDIRAAASVWPSVDTGELARAFNTLSQQQLTFNRCDIQVVDRRATAACAGELRYVQRVGRSSWQTRPAAWTFDLSRVGEAWTIQGVRAK